MPQKQTLRVHGYKEFMRATAQADKETKKLVRNTLRQVGDIVRQEATHRFSHVDAHSAGGYRTRVRQRGIAVEQSLRRTTGLHPEWGAIQMRLALVPAVEANEARLERDTEQALGVMAHHFESRP